MTAYQRETLHRMGYSDQAIDAMEETTWKQLLINRARVLQTWADHGAQSGDLSFAQF